LTPPAKFAAAVQALPDEYELYYRGPVYDVVIKSKIKKKLERKATNDQLAGLKDLMERYGESGFDNMPRGKFNASEERFVNSKGKQVLLQAFKPGQLRVYGYCQSFNGRPTFFITGFDPVKKQDDADQDVIAASGKEAVAVFDLLSAKGN